jgi:D-alanyl-D-alanine carboxypeptidase
MLKLSALCLASALLLQVPFCAAQTAPVSAVADTALAQRIDAAIAGYYKPTEPGASVIVVRDGKTVMRKAYGLASVEKNTPLDPGMSLRLGSITKQFTAVGILMLAEEGKLALGDDITKYVPGYATSGKKVTIEHLLTHTSGIFNYTNKVSYRGQMQMDLTPRQVADLVKDDPLEFEPGSKWNYSNTGYVLLGMVIEKVSGQPYANYIADRIFVPLGMKDTAYEGFERRPNPHASGHARGPNGFEPAKLLSMTQPYAAGSLVSTVDDLALWDAAISSGKLLKAATWKQAFTPYVLSDGKPTEYGYGWQYRTFRGTPMNWHGGGIPGFGAFALRLPEQKLFVAVLNNSGNGVASSSMVASRIAALALNKPFPEFKPVKLEPKALDALTGVYKLDEQNTLTIRRDKDGLVGLRNGRGQGPLPAYSETGLFIENSLVHMEFYRDAKGEVTGMTLHDAETVTNAPRIGPAPAEGK